MTKRMTLVLFSLLGLLLASALSVSAKGPADFVEIQLPGQEEPIRVEDPKLVEVLSTARFEAFGEAITTPKDVGYGVVMTRYFIHKGGKEAPFDRVVYFSDEGGGPGYALYLGILGGSSEQDGEWFAVSEVGEKALQTVLEAEAGTGSSTKKQDESALQAVDEPKAAAVIASADVGGLNGGDWLLPVAIMVGVVVGGGALIRARGSD